MGAFETFLFYLVIGIAVAVAVWTTEEDHPPGERSLRSVSAIAFWPVYIPILLSPQEKRGQPAASSGTPPTDELAAGIAQVEQELDVALASLDGWGEEALSREQQRISELRAAWNGQANRIRGIDQVLQSVPVFNERNEAPNESSHRAQQAEHARRQNLQRLRHVREQLFEDLTATLARVRELVSLIHLARFTGAPASRADELVARIATSVEGLTEVAGWQAEERTEEQESDDTQVESQGHQPCGRGWSDVRSETPAFASGRPSFKASPTTPRRQPRQ
jgi:hypothetical protein